MSLTVEQRIEQILESLRPYVVRDGGNILFDRFEEGIVYVRLEGACISCPASMITLKIGLEQSLKQEIPEVKEVKAL